MLVVLALFACSTETAPAPPPPPPPVEPVAAVPKPIPPILLADTEPVAIPAGEPITRDCFRPKPTMRAATATPSAPPAMPKKKSVAPTATRSEVASSTPMTKAADGATDSRILSPAEAAAPPPSAADPAPLAGAAPIAPRGQGEGAAGVASTSGGSVADVAAAPAAEPEPPADGGEAKEVAAEIAADRTIAEKSPAGPTFDWGGTTWLSNDDSMSLASAQHLLQKVKTGQRVRAGDVRPHELLNYFSFDTVAPAEGELFAVNPSAEKTGDGTLTVALAVKGATPPRRPMDLTFVIDRSGSMSAEGRMEYVKRALALGADQLVAGDRVDVVLFDDRVCTPLENFVVGRDDNKLLDDTIAKLAPEGGTNISIGLEEAYRIVADPARAAGIKRNRRVMLLTDAQVNQGTIDADALALVASGYEKNDVRLTGVGVGIGFEDKILDTVTEKGRGGYVYLGSEAVVDRLFGVGFRSMVETIAHDVQFELDLPPTLAMERFYGEESSTDRADVQPIHYSAGTTQLFLQDLKVDPSKLGPKDEITLTIHYKDAFTYEPGTQTFTWTVGQLMDADRHNLDKARALMGWTDLLLAGAMGGDTCGAALSTWSTRAAKVSGDAEITYVHGLVGKTCPGAMPLPDESGAGGAVAYKVKVDADVPIAEVELLCAGTTKKERLSAGDTVAAFDARPGACTVTLQGAVPMTAKVDVPSVGGDVKCMVRGGRMSCG